MKQIDGDTYQFECSGRTFYANNSIIGLSPDGDVSYGYDGGLPQFTYGEWTRAECLELCNFMIALWPRTAAAVEERKADDAADPHAEVLESGPRA